MTTEQTALQRIKSLCAYVSTDIEERGKYIFAKDIQLDDGETAKGAWIAEFNNAIPRCGNNVHFFITARTALPALIELCEAQDRLIAAKASAQLKDALGRACLDQRYLDAVADLNSASNAVEAAKARLEEVCPKK